MLYHAQVIIGLPADTLLVFHELLPPAGEGTVGTFTIFKGTLTFVASLLLPLVMVPASITNLSLKVSF